MKYIIAPVSDDLMHYGVDHLHSKTGRGSGRYAWGSGKNPRAAKREVYGGSESGVTRQKIQKLKSESRNHSGVDIQVIKYKKNISIDKGISNKSKFSTASNLEVVNKIAKDDVNCALCTYAMDLRERGKDVRANTKRDWQMKTGGTTTDEDIATWYKRKDGGSAEFNYFPSMYTEKKKKGFIWQAKTWDNTQYLKSGDELKERNDYIKSLLKSGGNGSFGHLTMSEMITDKNDRYYGYSISSHDVFYKIENGKVIIYDAQSNERMPYDKYMTQFESENLVMYPKGYLRTDDLELSKNSVSENIALETTTPDYNYSPSYKTVTKVKTNTQYSPPYVSDKKDILQYTPPYNTVTPKKVFQNATKKVKNVSINSGSKIKDTWNKVTTAVKNIARKATNTSPIAMLERLHTKNIGEDI